MGKLLSLLARDDSTCCAPQRYEVFLDFENAAPTDTERDVYEDVQRVLKESESVLEEIQNYKGAGKEIREAIAMPVPEIQQKAWLVVCPLVVKLRKCYEFSRELERVVPRLLGKLCGGSMSPTQHLETQQALVKQLAEILEFVLKFDEYKMKTPAIQNDFSYYRRTVSRQSMGGGISISTINSDLANRMSLFYAHATPMLKVLSEATSRFVEDNSDIPVENTTETLGTMAKLTHTENIIVIHPGSLYIRIGRASDLNPRTILHAIARRRKPGGIKHRDTFLPPSAIKTKELLQEMEEARLSVSHTLQSCLQSDGRRRYATPPQQIAAFNRRSLPETDTVNEEWYWVKPEPDCKIVVGNDVLKLDPKLDFNIHFPIRRGDLHIHPHPGGSFTSILQDLEDIWSYIIENQLKLKLSELGNYKAVLVVPDIYNRGYLREYCNLLMCKIGFGACFLVQDHVAATFGAGLGYACVVDIGDQKTSVSCVEDGISHRNTRVRMEYGGADITQTFYWLLQKCAFPYKACDEEDKLDAMLLRKLKEDFCHVNLDICGAQEKTFVVNKPMIPSELYTLQLGDECIVAPLSLFTPELFGITGTKYVLTQKRSSGDPEDPHDDNYLRETSRRGLKEALESSNLDLGAGDVDGVGGGADDDIVVDAIDNVAPSGADKEFILNPEQILGLDQAVLQSIERCPTEDLKRKMYGCILVVGGGMKFIGIGTWLQNRISLQIPYLYRAEQMDIITTPKEMDPAETAWKGAAIMSCLESAGELWIHRKEWEKQGVKILRERAPFMW